jgi:hypothetical protein
LNHLLNALNLNEHLLITLPMIYFDPFQSAGFDRGITVVSISVDPISQLDLPSTLETPQLISPVPIAEPGSPGSCEHSITHSISSWNPKKFNDEATTKKESFEGDNSICMGCNSHHQLWVS